MNSIQHLVIALAFAGAPSFALAQHAAHDHADGHEQAAPADLVEAEVKKVDKEAGKITLRHAEIKNLNMSAMTMVFRVADPAMLDQVKAGDKVRFAAERANGAIAIVRLEPAN